MIPFVIPRPGQMGIWGWVCTGGMILLDLWWLSLEISLGWAVLFAASICWWIWQCACAYA